MRLLLVLGVGLVIMAAGHGCQMPGERCGAMEGGMMDGRMGPMHGNASGASDAKTVDDPSLDDETAQWLQGARGFDGVADRTGQDVVVVEVGAGDGLEYGSPAVRVDPGTTIRWRWTGKGGRHIHTHLRHGGHIPLRVHAARGHRYAGGRHCRLKIASLAHVLS